MKEDAASNSQSNTEDSQILTQLKNDLRIVIEKMNEVCKLNKTIFRTTITSISSPCRGNDIQLGHLGITTDTPTLCPC